jgi:hypothetical protein
VVVTEKSAQSDWVRAEVNTAMRDPRFNKRVVPLKLDATKAAQITHELGLLKTVQLQDLPDPGAFLCKFLMKRETELRGSVHAASATNAK